MEELRLSHAWPPLARFCAAAAFFVGVSVMMIGCGGGGSPPVDSSNPIAVGQADGVAYLPIDIAANEDVYAFDVQTQGPRTISIAVEGGGNDFMVTQNLLTFVAGERSKPVTLQATMAINDIFATDNSIVTLIFGLRDIFDDSASLRFTKEFASQPRVTSPGGKVTLTISSPFLTAGATILPADQVSLSIFHLFGAKARYELEQPRSNFFAADPDNGKISLVDALPVGDYALTLRLIYGGLTATRSVDVRYPIAFGQVNDIETLSTDIAANEDAYTFTVRSQGPRTISIAVEGGGGSLTVTQSTLTLTAGENSFQLRAIAAINDIFAADNFVVTMTFGLRDISVSSITSSLTIRFISKPRVTSTGGTVIFDVTPRTILPEGATILPTESVTLSIIHLHGATARYELEQPERPQPPYFAADPDSGKIWLARDLPIGDSTLLTLRLVYGDVAATQFIEVRHLVLPVAVDLANDIAILPSGLGAGRVAYTFNVQSRDRRTISIAVEGGVGYFGVAPNLLDFDVGERSKPVTLTTVIPIDEIYKVDNRTVNMTFRLRDVADPLAATRFTIGFISEPRVAITGESFTLISPRTDLTAGATILPTASVALSIFHLHGATARYELEQPQPPLGQSQSPYFAADLDNGKITLARALPVGDYTLTLRLIYEGLTATRSVSVRSEYLQPKFVGNITNEIYFPASTGADAEVLQVTVTGDDVTVFVDSQLPIRARPVREEGEENGGESTVVYRVEFEEPLTSIITSDDRTINVTTGFEVTTMTVESVTTMTVGSVVTTMTVESATTTMSTAIISMKIIDITIYLTLRAQGALTGSIVFPTVAFATVDIFSGPRAFGRDDTLIIPAGGSGVALPAGEAGITIWHIALPDETNYKIDQSDDNIFTVDAKSGEISIVDILPNRSEHDLTLHMTGVGYESVMATISVTVAGVATVTVVDMITVPVTASRPLRIIGPPHQTVFLSGGMHTITVAAMARPGEEIAVVRSRIDRTDLALPPLVDFISLAPVSTGNFQADGGVTSRIRLGERGALELFTADGTELTANFQVIDFDGESGVLTLFFRSAPRVAANGGDLLTVLESEQVTTADVMTVVTEAEAGEADIWHLPSIDEKYTLSQVKATNLDRLDESTRVTDLFSVDIETGEVVLTAALEYNRAYEFALYLRGGGVEASRNVRVETPPYPGFYAQNDAGKGEGTVDSPYLISDIHQLQVIGGAVPDNVATVLAARWRVSEDFVQDEAARTFGANRLLSHYLLVSDIDASPTRAWAQGFAPIGGSENKGGFRGVFDGGDFLIRELHIRRPREDDVGLFSALEAGSDVTHLGLQNVEILGDERVGGFAGAMRGGALSINWISGLVSGNDDVGGFAGWQTNGMLEENWSSARIGSGGDGDGGGWVGRRAAGEAGRGYWAGVFEGNFSGRDNLGGLSSPLGAVGGDAVYWNPQASAPGLAQSGGGAVAVGAIQDLSANDFGGGWRVDGGDNFPALLGASATEQAIGVALGMTRWVGIGSPDEVVLRPGANGARVDLSPEFGWLRLDTNGFIARDVADFAPARCEIYDDDEGLPAARVDVGYNGVEIFVDLLAEDAFLSYTSDCRFGWSGAERDADVTLRLVFAAAASSTAPGDDVRQTIDYAARIAASDISTFDSRAYFIGLPQGVVTIGAAAAKNTFVLKVATRDPILLGTTMTISPAAAVDAASGGILETGGGRTVAVTLAVAATALFTEDNLEVEGNVVLTDGGQRRLHRVRFVSSPRAISFIENDVFTVVLPARTSRLTADFAERLQVWHYEGETYSILDGEDSEYFAIDGSRVSAVGGGLLPGLYTVEVEVAGGGASVFVRMIVDVESELSEFPFRDVVVPAGFPADEAILTLTVADGEFKPSSFSFLPFSVDIFESGGGDKAAVITINQAQIDLADEAAFFFTVTAALGERYITTPISVRSAPSFEPLPMMVEGGYFVPAFIGETARGNGVTISIGFRHLFGANPDPSHFSLDGAATNYFRLDADLDLEHIRNIRLSDLPVVGDEYGTITISGALAYDDGGSLVAQTTMRAFQITISFGGDETQRQEHIESVSLAAAIEWTEANAYTYVHELEDEFETEDETVSVSISMDGLTSLTLTMTMTMTLTTTMTVDLQKLGDETLDGSSAAKAFPIFNIWQLQAIDGREVVNGTLSTVNYSPLSTVNFTLFGPDEATRLSQHYRIMNDIDATPLATVVHVNVLSVGNVIDGFTEYDDRITAGFSPIGLDFALTDINGNAINGAMFTGGLYGDGFVVRGLRIISTVAYGRYTGLIAQLGGGGLISGVRLEDAILVGSPDFSQLTPKALGGLVAAQVNGGEIVASHFSGDIFAYPSGDLRNIGGLVGNFDRGVIIDSGSSGRVGADSSSATSMGGLVGHYNLNLAKIIRSWSSADVGSNSEFGGLVGLAHLPVATTPTVDIGTTIEGVWSAGRLTRSANDSGGLYYLEGVITVAFSPPPVVNVWTASEVFEGTNPLGRNANDGSAVVSLGYWGWDLVPENRGDRIAGEGVDDIRTLNSSHFSGDFWDFGTNSDFPLINSQSRSEQAAQIASGISKIVGRNNDLTVVLGDDLSIDHLLRGASFTLGSVYAEMELDTNGIASGAARSGMPAPSCAFADNEVRATTNYNNAVVVMTLISTVSGLNWVDRGVCAVSWEGVTVSQLTVRMMVSVTYGTETTTLSIDYPAEITNSDDLTLVPPPLRIEAFGEREFAPTLIADGIHLISLSGGRNPDGTRRGDPDGADGIVVRASGKGRATIQAVNFDGGRFQTAPPLTDLVGWATIELYSALKPNLFDDNELREVPVSVVADGQSATLTLTLAAIPELVNRGNINVRITLPVSVGQTILMAQDAPIYWKHSRHGLTSVTIVTDGDGPFYFPANDADASNNHYLANENVMKPGIFPIDIVEYQVSDYRGMETSAGGVTMTIALVDNEVLSLRREFDGAAYDWTRAEAYSYSVTVGTGALDLLRLNDNPEFDLDGSSPDRAIPIYNIWQLQGIVGVSVDAVGSVSSGVAVFPGDALSLHYILMNDIDAAPAREWDDGKGFTPIGDTDAPFLGIFEGRGNVVQNLFIDRATITIGLFGAVGKDGGSGGVVNDLGVANAEYRGSGDIGGVIGVLAGAGNAMDELWFSGQIFQSSLSNVTVYAGGVIGRHRQQNNPGVGGGLVQGLWAAGEIEVEGGGAENAGGIVGRLESDGSFGLDLEWFSYIASTIGGVYGSVAIDFVSDSKEAYVSREISALPADPSGTAVESLQSLQTDAGLLRFDEGTNDDFPVLKAFSASRQAIHIAAGLTRIRDKDGTALGIDGAIPAQNFGRMRLDTNGLAANNGTDQTATPDCVFVDDALRARTNYNQVSVIMTLLAAPTGVSFAHFDNFVLDDCEVLWRGENEDLTATVRLIFSVDEQTFTGDEGQTLTISAEALTVDRVVSVAAAKLPPFVSPNEITVPANHQPGDDAFSFTANLVSTTISVLNSENFGGDAQAGTIDITLLRPATEIFDSDNALRIIPLRLSREGVIIDQEILARSAPRFVALLDALTLNLPIIVGDTIAIDPLAIWHLDGANDDFRLIDDGGLPFSFEKNGAIVATADIDIDGEGEYYLSVEIENGDFSGEHNFTLRLTAEHERLRRAFVATVRWTVENAYSYEFAKRNENGELVMIDLRLIGNNVLDGLIPRLPVPIYNVWQLQAINGAGELPPDALALEFSARARAIALLGENAEERLGRHYRLMNDIDAYPTRQWGDAGFAPLGDADSPFAGSLDGNGKVVRGLYSRRNDASLMGVLAGAVSNLGVDDVLVVADGDDAQIGAIAASVAFGGRIDSSWAAGRGNGGDSDGYSFGGLAGAMAGGSAIEGSWAAVDMTDAKGQGDSAGGLVGELNGIESQHATLRAVWSAGDIAVDEIDRAGGAIGLAFYPDFVDFRLSGVWSVGEVETNATVSVGGFLGELASQTTVSVGTGAKAAFWSPEISGLIDAVGLTNAGSTTAVVEFGSLQTLNLSLFGVSLQTLSVAQIGDDFNVGRSNDFPLITLFEQSQALQAAHLARALTQIKGVGDAAFPRYVNGPLRLSRSDYSYLSIAADEPIESCIFEDNAIIATLGYNNAMARLSLPSPGVSGARFVGFSADQCRADLPDVANNSPISVRWEIWSEEEGEGYTLTVDYSVSFESPPGEIQLPRGEILVPANAMQGDPVLTLHFPGGYINSFLLANGLESEGGDNQAVVNLLRSPRKIFLSDHARVTLSVQSIQGATHGDVLLDDNPPRIFNEVEIVFRSTPRGINGPSNNVVTVASETQATAGYALDLSPVLSAGLSIWHNDDADEFFSLSQPRDDFTVDPDSGVITARRNFVGEIPLTLRLTDAPSGVNARFSFLLVVDGDKVAIANRLFEAQIERGEVNWLGDLDLDGTLNAYDWTPGIRITGNVTMTLPDNSISVAIILTEVNILGDADGSAMRPWPIYNVWQLQAINSVGVSADGAITGGLRLFGDGDNLTAHYRLMFDIDATPTRAWGGGDGFSPIGDNDNPFIGYFDGNGKAVRGLYIDRVLDQIGIFGVAQGATIVGLGVEDGRIGGNASVAAGGIVGEARSVEIIDSWFSGRIDTVGDNAIGGLAGILTLSADSKFAGAWVAGRIESRDGVAVAGGVIGRTIPSSATIEFEGVWSIAEVAAATVGGVIGKHEGLASDFSASITAYWSVETSGVDDSDGNSAGIRTAQTLRAEQISATVGAGADVGSDEDFPLLKASSRARQAVNIAAGLTRILSRDGGAERELPRGYVRLAALPVDFRILEFDSNGLAVNDVSARSSAPSCAFADGGLQAATNYNNVAVSFSLLSDSGASLRDIGTKGDCLFGWRDVRDETALTLRAVFSSAYGPFNNAETARLTFDYRLTVAVGTAERLNDSSAVNDGELTPLADDYQPRVYHRGATDSSLLPLPVEARFPPTGDDLILSIDDDDNSNTVLACEALDGGLSARSKYNAGLIRFSVENTDGDFVGAASDCRIVIPAAMTGAPFMAVFTFEIGAGESRQTVTRRHRITRDYLPRVYVVGDGVDDSPLLPLPVETAFPSTGNLTLRIDDDDNSDTALACEANSPLSGGLSVRSQYDGALIRFSVENTDGDLVGAASNCRIVIPAAMTGAPFTAVLTFEIVEGGVRQTVTRRHRITRDYLPRVYLVSVSTEGDEVILPLLPLPVETPFPSTGDLILRIDDDDNSDTALACVATSGDLSGGLSARSQQGALLLFAVRNTDRELVGTVSGCRIVIPATAAGAPFDAVLTFEIGEGEARQTVTRRHRITR